MKPIIDENEEAARAQVLHDQVRPTTFALAALIFGVAGVSALWLLVVAGLQLLLACGAVVLSMRRERRSPNLLTYPRNGGATPQTLRW